MTNMEDENKSIYIENLCLEALNNKCDRPHDWIFNANAIKSVSFCERDERCLFFYVYDNSDVFQMLFPSRGYRDLFHKLLLDVVGPNKVLQEPEATVDQLNFEYEIDENQKRITLGKGSYGVVYAGRDLRTQVSIAIKEIPERTIGLHAKLHHNNIVKYLGSVLEDGYFKIIMERVPGGEWVTAAVLNLATYIY
ncbi:MAP3K15 [Cordylochernes scorpioides]|uniref:MAP3K15 n=1 Tax=Cordylochernes scorpioides TaxID=51811 RepID=A0ABY6JZT7_9ARAC|nr:MAP3K15 [Cordylochernes scorpioides]